MDVSAKRNNLGVFMIKQIIELASIIINWNKNGVGKRLTIMGVAPRK